MLHKLLEELFDVFRCDLIVMQEQSQRAVMENVVGVLTTSAKQFPLLALLALCFFCRAPSLVTLAEPLAFVVLSNSFIL